MAGEGSDNVVRIEARLDTTYLKQEIEEVEGKIGRALETTKLVDEKITRSFNDVMTTARTGYMLMAGMARIMGTGMTEIFRTSYQIIVGAIGAYSAMAAAEAAKGPIGWVQAALMWASVAAAGVRLVAIASGQTDLSRQMRGVWMGLHGISSMLGSFMRL